MVQATSNRNQNHVDNCPTLPFLILSSEHVMFVCFAASAVATAAWVLVLRAAMRHKCIDVKAGIDTSWVLES